MLHVCFNLDVTSDFPGWCFLPAGIQTDSVLSARLQIIRIYIREDGRLVIEFKTHAKFRGQFTTSTTDVQVQEKSGLFLYKVFIVLLTQHIYFVDFMDL